jgi:uncharacterized protein (DUF1501 family)
LAGACGSPEHSETEVLSRSFNAAPPKGIVVPHFKLYYEMPNGAMQRRENRTARSFLDGHFALHPSLQQLKPLGRGQLAIVHAASSPDNTRPTSCSGPWRHAGQVSEDGWLNRALAPSPGAAAVSPVRAIAMGAQLPHASRRPASRGGE